MKEPRWIKFDHVPCGDKPQDQFWTIRSKAKGHALGDIEWFHQWRRYVLTPMPDCLFDQECLTDIAAFLGEMTKAYKP